MIISLLLQNLVGASNGSEKKDKEMLKDWYSNSAVSFLFVVLLFVSNNSIFAVAQESKQRKTMNSKQEIIQLENEIFEAIKNKDAKKLGSILAEDFVYRTYDGKESNKSAFLGNIKSFQLKILSVKGEHLNAEVFGDVAVLTGVQRARVEMEDSTIVEGLGAFTDVFVRQNKRWLLKSAFHVELPSKTESEKKDE